MEVEDVGDEPEAGPSRSVQAQAAASEEEEEDQDDEEDDAEDADEDEEDDEDDEDDYDRKKSKKKKDPRSVLTSLLSTRLQKFLARSPKECVLSREHPHSANCLM